MEKSRNDTWFFKWKGIISWPISAKVTLLVAKWWEVWDMDFQENLSNGSSDTCENAFYSLSKVTDHNQTYIGVHAWIWRGVVLQEIHSNGSWDTDDFCTFFSNKVPLITDQSPPNLTVCSAYVDSLSGASGQSLLWKPKYRSKSTLF